MISDEPLSIRFDKIDGFIRVYDETGYFVLFGAEKYDFIYNRIRYLIGGKNNITYVASHNFAKSKGDSYDYVPLEKTLTLDNVAILIMSVFSKDKNNYYYNIYFRKRFVWIT